MGGERVGIRALATYVPEGRISAEEIASATEGRWTARAVRDKLGIEQKAVPGPDDGAQEMGARAALRCLERAGVDPLQVDAILCIGDELREFPLTTSGIYIQERIGAQDAWAVDVMQKCSSFAAGVRLGRALLRAEPGIRRVLLAGGYRNGDAVDYTNPRVSFMYNLAPGGGAALLERGCERNEILGTSLISDGALARHVIGIRDSGELALEVTDQAGMRRLLAERSQPNFQRVVRESLAQGGLGIEHIDYLALLHVKRSAHRQILTSLGLEPHQSTYLSDYGHLGQFDQILSMELAAARGRLAEGDVVVAVGAGIGYSWGAVALRWGRVAAERHEVAA